MTDEEALVLGFADIGARALAAVGGKGANLAWMARAGCLFLQASASPPRL